MSEYVLSFRNVMDSRNYKLEVGYCVPKHQQSILELEQLVWGQGEPGSYPYFEWQYMQNPLGAALTASVTSSSGKLVAHIASVPVPLEIDGHWFCAGLVVNAVTHPDHRHRGLFERVGRALIDESHRVGPSVLICVPNEFSSRVFRNKLGFHAIPKHWLMVKWIDPGAFLSQHGLALFGRALSAATKPFFTGYRAQGRLVNFLHIQPIDDIRLIALERLLPHLTCPENLREIDWFYWRYGRHPTRRYEFVIAGSPEKPFALMVYQLMKGYSKAYLTDFIFSPEISLDTLKGLIMFINNNAQRKGSSAIWCIAKPKSQRAQLLRKCGFLVVRLGLVSAPPLLARSTSPDIHESTLSKMELSFGSLINCD